MSRYDQPTQEPDMDRYEPKPVEDMDVPDFDQPDPIVTDGRCPRCGATAYGTQDQKCEHL